MILYFTKMILLIWMTCITTSESLFASADTVELPQAKNGVLDLSQFKIEELPKNIPLIGEWKLHWQNDLYSYKGSDSEIEVFEKKPELFKNHKGEAGVGVYALDLIMPKGIQTIDLRIFYNQFYRLEINDVLHLKRFKEKFLTGDRVTATVPYDENHYRIRWEVTTSADGFKSGGDYVPRITISEKPWSFAKDHKMNFRDIAQYFAYFLILLFWFLITRQNWGLVFLAIVSLLYIVASLNSFDVSHYSVPFLNQYIFSILETIGISVFFWLGIAFLMGSLIKRSMGYLGIIVALFMLIGPLLKKSTIFPVILTVANLLVIFYTIYAIVVIYKKFSGTRVHKQFLVFYFLIFLSLIAEFFIKTAFTTSIFNLMSGLAMISMVILCDVMNHLDDEKLNKSIQVENRKIKELEIILEERVAKRTAELTTRKEKTKFLFEQMNEAILVMDRNFMISKEHCTHCENIFTNFSDDQDFESLLHDQKKLSKETVNNTIKSLTTTFSKNKLSQELSEEVTAGDRIIELSWDAVFNDENAIQYIILTLLDVTEKRRAAAEKIAKEQELKIQFEELQQKAAESKVSLNPVFEAFSNELSQLSQDKTQSDESFLDNLKSMVENASFRPLAEILKDQVASLSEMAKKLSKEPPKVIFTGNPLGFHRDLHGTLQDVMVHCLRNSLDHGLESPEERLASQKSAQGTISLHLIENTIELYDDGRGLNLRALRKKAKPGTTDSDVAESIFASGMSTAAQVTDISGRGVGMDAVRSFIQGKGGSIEIQFRGGNEGDDFRPFALVIRLAPDQVKPALAA